MGHVLSTIGGLLLTAAAAVSLLGVITMVPSPAYVASLLPAIPWKRDEHLGRPMHVLWRSTSGGALNDYDDQHVDLKHYNASTDEAWGCYRSNPQACGLMSNFYPGCANWLRPFDAEQRAAFVSDGKIGAHESPYVYWTPNGTLTTDSPVNSEHMDAQWLMEIGSREVGACVAHLPPKYRPRFSGSEDGVIHGFTAKEVAAATNFTDAHHQKRAALANDELAAFFAMLPTDSALYDTAGGGAALVHKHMTNDAIVQANALHAAYSAVLGKSQKRSWAWKLVRRGSVDADVAIDALHTHIVARAQEEDRKWTELLATGALTKVLRERIMAGEAGEVDVKALNRVFDQVHGKLE